MSRRLHSATDLLGILAEAMAWFIVLRVLTSTSDHAGLTTVLRDVERGAGGPVEDPSVLRAAEVLRDALDGLASGPSLPVMVLAAFTAVFVSRAILEQRLSRAWSAGLGLVASVMALNLLLHITLAGDLMFWDSSGIADAISPPPAVTEAESEVEAFVADPSIARVTRPSQGVVVAAMLVMWARFIYVGRGRVGFPQALRAFSLGFPFVLFAVLVAPVPGVAASIFALPYFVISMLTLAVGNAARVSEREDELTRATPWAVSALVTLGLLTAVAMLFSLLAFLEVERVLLPVGDVFMTLVTWLMVIILTPIIFVMQWVLERVVGDFAEPIQDAAEGGFGFELETEEEEQGGLPGWVGNAFKLAFFALLTYASYYAARLLFRRGREREAQEQYVEEREAVEGRGGLGDLLRKLMPRARPRGPAPRPWMDRHTVYRLFGRAVRDAEDRGFGRRPGETPIEFARVASRALDAEPLTPIASAFDRARYGRHFPSDEDLAPLSRALSEWERTHPPTEELRGAVRRDAPDEDELPPPEPPDPPEPPPMPQPGMIG